MHKQALIALVAVTILVLIYMQTPGVTPLMGAGLIVALTAATMAHTHIRRGGAEKQAALDIDAEALSFKAVRDKISTEEGLTNFKRDLLDLEKKW